MNYSLKTKLVASLLGALFLNLVIYWGRYQPFYILIWLAVLLVPILPGAKKLKWSRALPAFRFRHLLVLAAVLLPALVRIANFNPNRIHGDELISAYFSAHYRLLGNNFFAPVPAKGEWVCQFPSLFFVLQKTTFLFLGTNLLAVKLSTIPYILLAALMLFLIGRQIFDWRLGVLAVFVYSFLAVSLYHETLGLHFVSSAAVFLIFFYFLALEDKKFRLSTAWLTGVFGGLCYLFYTSSYLALPILVAGALLRFFRQKKLLVAKSLAISLLSFFLTLSPFLAYMAKSKNFYLSGRINQVSLLWGSWSGASGQIREKATADNFLLSFRSLYTPNIGGHGGYDFGRLAFFDPLTRASFLLGLVFLSVLMVRKKALFLVFLTIAFSFIAGAVLTIPPPPFHRLSLTFPLVALVIALPFYYLLRAGEKFSPLAAKALVVAGLVLFGLTNQNYFLKAVTRDGENPNLKIARLIVNSFADRKVYIAAFPGFHLEKIIYFLQLPENPRVLGATTGYHESLLGRFNPEEKYLYVILFPETFEKSFSQADPKGKLIKFSPSYSLMFN